MLLLSSPLWVKQAFTSGISVSKMTVETFKIISTTNIDTEIDYRVYWCLNITWLMPCNFFRFLRHGTCCSKIYSKTFEFRRKIVSKGSCSEVTEWSQQRCRTDHNAWGSMSFRIYNSETEVESIKWRHRESRKKLNKVGVVWSYAHCVLPFQLHAVSWSYVSKSNDYQRIFLMSYTLFA